MAHACPTRPDMLPAQTSHCRGQHSTEVLPHGSAPRTNAMSVERSCSHDGAVGLGCRFDSATLVVVPRSAMPHACASFVVSARAGAAPTGHQPSASRAARECAPSKVWMAAEVWMSHARSPQTGASVAQPLWWAAVARCVLCCVITFAPIALLTSRQCGGRLNTAVCVARDVIL